MEPAVTTTAGETSKADVPYYVRACALGIPAYLVGVHLWTWVFTGYLFLHGAADFRAFYTSGWAVRSGHASQLYDISTTRQLQDVHVGGFGITLPYDHPPFEALLFVPFSKLDYKHAYLLFLAFNICLLVATFWMLRPSLRKLGQIYWWLPGALFVAFLPVAAALIQGQDSLILLALLTAAAVSLERQNDRLAGVLVALGLFRLQVTLPIAFLFLLWRRWHFLAGFIASAVTLVGISILLMGSSVLNYAQVLLNLSVRFESPVNQATYAPAVTLEAMPNIRGLIVGITHLSGIWLQVLVFTLSAALILLAVRLAPKGADAILLAIIVSVPMSYHLLIHDLSVLLLPIAVTLNEVVQSETCSLWQERLKVRLAALVFMSPLLISYAPSHFWIVSMPLLAFAVVACVFRVPKMGTVDQHLLKGQARMEEGVRV